MDLLYKLHLGGSYSLSGWLFLPCILPRRQGYRQPAPYRNFRRRRRDPHERNGLDREWSHPRHNRNCYRFRSMRFRNSYDSSNRSSYQSRLLGPWSDERVSSNLPHTGTSHNFPFSDRIDTVEDFKWMEKGKLRLIGKRSRALAANRRRDYDPSLASTVRRLI